ncbi:hypothetical protein QIS96_04355 [Streptomyces sp. B-S-A6]|uniref:DUF308 domain-containing protein n=1 Tax=Streptomyces cavernicola TaxID=3043613 RepID=A0ABT6S6I5_9ACTN|nr:hypothetical protein [Streptomyces sp. B-S-A6]MDI3403058.1 hypothetical protein [Streptomyces sp. B-S-A6]
MAEHGAERDGSREEDDGHPRLDEDAAWEAIVAGYGEEPPDPPGAKPFKSVEDLAGLQAEANDAKTTSRQTAAEDAASEPSPDASEDDDKSGGDKGSGKDSGSGDGKVLGGSLTFAPGVGPGPRDYSPSSAADDDFDEDDEGHFVPPEPPPLPEADTTAKFAWLAVVGGPVLLLLAVLLGWDMTWWLTTLGIGGFVGGFATLVLRMSGDDDEDDDPGRGAVV